MQWYEGSDDATEETDSTNPDPKTCGTEYADILSKTPVPPEAFEFIVSRFRDEIIPTYGASDENTPAAELADNLGIDIELDETKTQAQQQADVLKATFAVRPLNATSGAKPEEYEFYIARLSRSTNCGVSGNCPMVLFGRSLQTGEWKLFSNDLGGSEVYLSPATSEPIRFYVSSHVGAGATGLESYSVSSSSGVVSERQMYVLQGKPTLEGNAEWGLGDPF